MKKHISLIVFSIFLHLFGYYVLLNRIEPFQYFFYLTSWWSYIIFLDALLTFKKKTFLIVNRRLPSLILISCGFWCIFEIINLRIQNWFYINLPVEVYRRYAGYLLSYGTVIPAIYITKELIFTLFGEIKAKPFHIKNYPLYSISLGILTILLTCLFPAYFFPLTWIFFALIFDGYNYVRGHASFMKDFERGSMGNFIAAMISGLICGLLWEIWNYWSISKWIYSVPLFEDSKIFEMPIPGYIGFLVFGLETLTLINFLNGRAVHKKSLYPITLIATAISILSFPMIDRYTVFSYATKIDKLSFIEQEKLSLFIAKGVKTSFGIDVNQLNEEERELVALLHLKGLGYKNFSKLRKQGVKNIQELSKYNKETLSRIVEEKNIRRVRVYIKAARRYNRQ